MCEGSRSHDNKRGGQNTKDTEQCQPDLSGNGNCEPRIATELLCRRWWKIPQDGAIDCCLNSKLEYEESHKEESTSTGYCPSKTVTNRMAELEGHTARIRQHNQIKFPKPIERDCCAGKVDF
ncbi:hypothetical protein GCM10008994_14980 [Halorubrum ejinorense]|uniref:Uncharacterized protein n=1 Tax=Halorubrum ejinorense TaxID=425309 RepID=A0AAV3SSK5_9EURY